MTGFGTVIHFRDVRADAQALSRWCGIDKVDSALVDRPRDPTGPQEPRQEAHHGAEDAGPHQQPAEAFDARLPVGQRALGVGLRANG